MLIGVERLVSNDLTAIVLVGSDDQLEIARCRVGFGYSASVSSDHEPAVPPAGSLTVIDALREHGESVIVDDPQCALGPAGSTLGAALQIGDRRIGFVVLESVTKGFFTAAHAERLRAIADQAAAAISNARLAGQATELAAAEERQRLSQELHDAVNQTLWTAALTADSLLREVDEGTALHGRLERLRQLTSGAQAEMRTLLLELRPQELIEIELHELLEQLIAAMECRKKMTVRVRLEAVDLDAATRVAFYRIAQEALTNITRHSAASVVSIALTRAKAGAGAAAISPSGVELRIVDNGRGFDTGNVPPGHLGLSIMQERAAAVGGELLDPLGAGSRHGAAAAGRGRAMSDPITVLVVDDHDLLREGVSSCLSAFDDLEVIGESSSGEEGLEAAARLRPDVVVIDLIMPGMGGVEAIRQMRLADDTVGLLALSTFASGDLIREAIGAGASGYLVKSVDTEGLAQAVRDVAAGRGSFSSDVTRVLAAPESTSPAVEARFTEREAEVAELMADGRSNAEIAEALNLSVFTVKNHVSSILMKLQAQSRTEATAIILRGRSSATR